MQALSEFRPKTLRRIIDCVREASVDISDWERSDNPSHCYAWSFFQPGKVVVFNLWIENMLSENDKWMQRHNLRKRADKETGPRKARARRMDRDARDAYENGLPVKVILLDRKRPTDERAAKRSLDTADWAVTNYNQRTGEWTVVRGATPVRFVDQYSVAEGGGDEPKRRDVSGSTFVREREIRDQALSRAGGNCEYCGERGFEMANGNIYLETHHIVPLFEGGKDVVANVAALCANDHRKAHHSKMWDEMRVRLLKCISGKLA